jgi:hypothetical protein
MSFTLSLNRDLTEAWVCDRPDPFVLIVLVDLTHHTVIQS